jgi:hypothetical protein
MSVVEESMLAIHAALCELTGRVEMSAFQTLSAGKIGHVGALGTGVPARATGAGISGVAGTVARATGKTAAARSRR